MITHPTVTDDFDGQILAIDAAIKAAAVLWDFRYQVAAPKFENVMTTPQIVFQLVSHFVKRGFNVTYNGEAGNIVIEWHHPNFTGSEHKQITRSIPDMIPNLGTGFRASMLYLCMTNGSDLRKHTDQTVQRSLNSAIKEAAALGNSELSFGFPDVPAPAVGSLFIATIELLIDLGFVVVYDTANEVYIVKWSKNFAMSAHSGENTGTLVV